MSIDEGHREALRARVARWRAAEAREAEVRQREAPMSPDQAWAAALELCALDPAAFEAPGPVREREVAVARAAWAKLRAHPAWRAPTPR